MICAGLVRPRRDDVAGGELWQDSREEAQALESWEGSAAHKFGSPEEAASRHSGNRPSHSFAGPSHREFPRLLDDFHRAIFGDVGGLLFGRLKTPVTFP